MTTSPTIAEAAREIVRKWARARFQKRIFNQTADELVEALRALLAETRGDEGFSSLGGKPFAHFQWNPGWRVWQQVIPEAAGNEGVIAAYRAPPTHEPAGDVVERVARAICRSAARGTPEPILSEFIERHLVNHVSGARAAIAALREPTPAMRLVGAKTDVMRDAITTEDYEYFACIFRNMIDAALSPAVEGGGA